MVKKRKGSTASQWASSAARRLRGMAGNPSTIDDAVRIVVAGYLDGIACPPTDLEALSPRLNVIEIRAEDIPFSGELRREKGGFVVVCSSSLGGPRKRFTIAHEMAHAIFAASGPGWPRTGKELERLCDMMATELLMPRSLFLERCDAFVSLEKIRDVGRLFQTSLSATAIRCAELFGLSVFEADREEIRWGYGEIRKGPLGRIDADLRASILDGFKGPNRSDILWIKTDRNGPSWWKFECQRLGKEDRALVLLRPMPRDYEHPFLDR